MAVWRDEPVAFGFWIVKHVLSGNMFCCPVRAVTTAMGTVYEYQLKNIWTSDPLLGHRWYGPIEIPPDKELTPE